MIFPRKRINRALAVVAGCSFIMALLVAFSQGLLWVDLVGVCDGPWVRYYEKELNKILFTLTSGFIVSAFLWIIVVYLPEWKKERILSDNLLIFYRYFKEDVIRILLSSLKVDAIDRDSLLDPKEFRFFFEMNGHEKFYKAMSEIQSNEALVSDLRCEFELFSRELNYYVSQSNNVTSDAIGIAKRMSQHTYRLNNGSVFLEDNIKYYMRFIWDVFAQWSFNDGDRGYDLVERIVGKA